MCMEGKSGKNVWKSGLPHGCIGGIVRKSCLEWDNTLYNLAGLTFEVELIPAI